MSISAIPSPPAPSSAAPAAADRGTATAVRLGLGTPRSPALQAQRTIPIAILPDWAATRIFRSAKTRAHTSNPLRASGDDTRWNHAPNVSAIPHRGYGL